MDYITGSSGSISIASPKTSIQLNSLDIKGNLTLYSLQGITSNGLLEASSIGLYSFGGLGVGSSLNPVYVDTPSLAGSGYAGSVFINDNYSSGINLQSSTANNELAINSNSSINVYGTLSAGVIALATNANNGNINLNASLTGVSNVFLSATGSGNIIQNSSLNYIKGNSVSLVSGSGNIGQGYFNTEATNLLVSTSASSNIFNNSNNPLTLFSANTGRNFTLTTLGNLTVLQKNHYRF